MLKLNTFQVVFSQKIFHREISYENVIKQATTEIVNISSLMFRIAINKQWKECVQIHSTIAIFGFLYIAFRKKSNQKYYQKLTKLLVENSKKNMTKPLLLKFCFSIWSLLVSPQNRIGLKCAKKLSHLRIRTGILKHL